MSNKNELKAELQGIKSVLDELEIKYGKGMIDIGRYLQLKEEYETRKAKLLEELDAPKEKSEQIKDFIYRYQYSLRALIASLPDHENVARHQKIATIGFSEIWPCDDGAVILIYQRRSQKIKVAIKNPLNKTVTEFLKSGKVASFYDEQGNRAPGSPSIIKVGNVLESLIHLAGNKLRVGTQEYHPHYQRAIIIGWNAQLPEPDEQALNDFQIVFVTRNIAGPDVAKLSPNEEKRLVSENANKVTEEFGSLLKTAQKEEELQQFLAEHPELLYPDFIECFPKFKLGNDWETDYVFLVQGLAGPEYVFVEIEHANKQIFTKKGQFSALFTQAKNQILDWDTWITQNQSYISSKLPGLLKPKFHLVMGRSTGLTNDQRAKIKTEFASTTRRFSTYDDLIDRFQQIVSRIVNAP